MLSRSFLPTTPRITPGAERMFVLGLAQFGWFKTLNAVISGRSRTRSQILMYLASETCHTDEPGPTMTPRPEVPKEPGVGGPNTEASNQRETER